MHVAFALTIAVPIPRPGRDRVTRSAWGLYPLIVTFVIVTSANHFVIDAVLGGLTAALRAWAAAWMAPARQAARGIVPARATA
jgi:hypothetical protein